MTFKEATENLNRNLGIPTEEEKEAEGRRKLAILKAVGLDRAAPEQRELAIAIAKRYDLDLMLKHLVLIDGKPYVTRDALLWIAHRDGNLDGIEVTEPIIRDYQGTEYWFCEAAVYRKDMGRPFKYGGRYPVKGQNAKFGPEMAVKVAESMALRRAFNISAPTQDERWDQDVPAAEPEPPKSLAEKVAEKAAAVQEPASADSVLGIYKDKPEEAPDLTAEAAAVFEGDDEAAQSQAAKQPFPGQSPLEQAMAAMPPKLKDAPAGMVQCESKSPFGEDVQCKREQGHKGAHRTETESWQ